MNDETQNWNFLLEKLKPQVSDPGSKVEEMKSQFNLLQQAFGAAMSNGASPEIKSQPTESENILPHAVISYIEEIPELQITDVKNFKPEEKAGRSMAVNSRFICYLDENDTLIIKSLKNLSLVRMIQELDSKILDLVFLDASLQNYLALICKNGTLVVYNIHLTHAKDKIITKYVAKHSFERSFEKAQIQWKDAQRLGIVTEKELIIVDLQKEEVNPEMTENPPRALPRGGFQLPENIREFTFSPSYPLVYLLLESSTVRIINLENIEQERYFTPHDSSAGAVVKLLSYRSLVRHQPIKSNEEGSQSFDQAFRDIFITITESFEIKVWDLSEWDQENNTFYCIETFQLNQNNDKLDPIFLINRFAFYDPGLCFLFVGFKTNGNRGISITALHIDQLYYGYSDTFNTAKRSKKFFNSVQTFWFRKNDLTDISVLNFGDDELEFYFKKNSYVQIPDYEPASTRTQDGSYAYNSKSVLIFFVHNQDTISLFKVFGEKLYPFALVEELDKMTQAAEQFDTQSNLSKGEILDSSFPPEIPTVLQGLINDNKKVEDRKETEKPIKVLTESEYGKIDSKDNTKKAEEVKTTEHKKETTNPEGPKPHKKKHEKKDKGGDAEQIEQVKHKAPPTKIVTRENNQKNQMQAPSMKSVESLEKELQAVRKDDTQLQNIEKIIEGKFQDLTDKSIQALSIKFNKIEEIIENKVNEKVSKLQTDSVSNSLSKEIDDKLQREFGNSFERTVAPCFEKYLMKMFEHVCGSLEKGNKFYIDKLTVEQGKSAQFKETMNEVANSFIKTSDLLTQGVINNQNKFNQMESSLQDKQNQISRLIDQMTEIIQKQQDVQKRVDQIEIDLQCDLEQYQNELVNFREVSSRYIDKFNEISSQHYLNVQNENNDTKNQEESKREVQYHGNSFGMYPPGTNNYYNNPMKPGKEKVPDPLSYQLAFLQNIMAGRPMDMSGGPINRGFGGFMPGMSPANSQMFNQNFYQNQLQQQYDNMNAYQKAKASFLNQQAANQIQNLTPQQGLNPALNTAQNIPPNLNLPYYNPSQLTQQAQTQPQPQMSGQQFAPEYQAFYDQIMKQKNKEKEDEKDRSFSRPPQEASPYIQNILPQQDNSKKFFDMNQITQVQPPANQQTPSNQRTLTQLENPQLPKIQSTPSPSFSQQDQDNLAKIGGQQLPPGMQGNAQPQPNFMQILQSLPPNLQQNFAQQQNLNQQKSPATFPQGLPGQNVATPQSHIPQNNNQMPQNQIGAAPNMYLQNMFPQNMGAPSNMVGFTGYAGLPAQMNHAVINKMGGTKTTSSVDISQIPLVNSMFKTPSRDTVEENTNNTSNNTNIGE